MRRKALIVITLIIAMLLSSFLPLVEAQAATTTTMTFNADLYKGLKSYFQEAGIEAEYNDVERSISMDSEVLNGIEAISLKEKGISDISGLEFFPNVKSLILSANNISEESNLSVLNSLGNLTYLDLSSNNLTDISEIEPLIIRLLAADSNAVNLSSQVAKRVYDVEVDLEEEKTTETFTLPKILEMAGIASNGTLQNKGQMKAEWFTIYNQKSNGASSSAVAPYVIKGTIPNPVTAEDNTFEIQVGYEGSTYVPYEGLIKFVINIKDTSSNGYNTNPASQNILKDSVFTLYYVVHLADTDGIIIKDKNLYEAIKEQLTENQEINPDLLSYRYGATNSGEVFYDVCEYSLNGTTATLKIDGQNIYTLYNFGGNSGEGTIYDISNNKYYYNVPYEVIDEQTADANGNVTIKRKIRIPHINTDCRDLYVDAYDEPQAFVITDLDLVNKITSLILNDKRITDLSGLEHFIGLESNLNVSYNYIDTLAQIYALQLNKESANSSLQALFNEKKDAMNSTKTKIITAYNKVLDGIKAIREQIKIIEENRNIMASVAPDSNEYGTAQKAIESAMSKIYGAGGDDQGLLGEIDNVALNDPQDGLNAKISEIYPRLEAMYRVFNKEYKLTTILTPALNYQTEEEYLAYVEQNKTLEGAKALAKAQISRIDTFEKAGALSSLEKDLIVSAFNLALSDEQQYPISYALNEMVKAYEETDARRTDWMNISSQFIEIGVYSQISNYCLLERMNNDTAAGACYGEEYLQNLIEEYTYEGIDTKLVQAIYNKLANGTGSSVFTSKLNNIFTNYINSVKTYDGTTFNVCKGDYYQVQYLDVKLNDAGGYPVEIGLIETVNSKTSSSGAFFFEQLLSLANKFTAIDETAIYIKLPSLKRLDVRNNEIDSLGPTEVTMVAKDGTRTTTTETLATLKNLKELYAGHNFVSGDITCVDWSTLNSLKNLDLSYNFIRDILPLEVLTNLRYLDVSDNLLEGEFNLSLRKMEKLKDLKLAGNRYTDINKILLDYEMLANGDFTKYFAREDTLNLDLSRQELEIIIEEPIQYNSSANVKEIELPPIFAQLEFIDAERTAFGTTSSKGSIQARGGIAYIPVHEAGDYTATVKVIAANGYPENVETSIGINTNCTIKYSVQSFEITGVTINENVTTMQKGSTQTFTATVTGTDVENKNVTWTVTGNTSANTTIDSKGILTVASDEASEKITITATSVMDNTKSAKLDISIVEAVAKKVTKVTVKEDKTLALGAEATFTATVEGENLTDADKAIEWSVLGNNSAYTIINKTTGKLVIAADETAEAITVIATSKLDNTKIGTAIVKLIVVREVEVVSNKPRVAVGSTAQMTATVKGTNLTDTEKAVTWEVTGGESSETKISDTGLLTVGQNETATSLIVKATSVTNPEISGSKEIKISVEEPEYGYNISNDGTEIIGISPNTENKAFKSKLVNDSSYTVEVRRNGETISDNAYVATSDIVVISKNGQVVETYELVVKGDVNGDGVADALDSSLMKAYRAKLTNLSGAFLDAADINNDGEVSIIDVRLLLYHRARIDGYIL